MVAIHVLTLLVLELNQLPCKLLVVLVEHLFQDHVLGMAQLFIDCLESYLGVLVSELLHAADDGLDDCALRAVKLENISKCLNNSGILDVSLLFRLLEGVALPDEYLHHV